MLHKAVNKSNSILEKLDYLNLNLDNLPQKMKKFESLDFRVPKFYEENQYRQYRYIPIQDIQILLSPTNRLDDLGKKYKESSPIFNYLDNSSEENFIRHTTFLNMLKHVNINEIEEIEQEQIKLNKGIPFKVKFQKNYLWQIYYSEEKNRYFMLVPTEDTDYSTFFFLLKKQIQDNKNEKIFVPVRGVNYSREYLTKSQFEDIENYLWLFTKDWPIMYEVYNKDEQLSIQIIGETEVYGKIKSLYKTVLDSKVNANRFYKLLKALFILQTELPEYFQFKTNINPNGEIEFSFENEKIKYKNIPQWINTQYETGITMNKEIDKLLQENKEKHEHLKIIAVEQEIEYIAKEKQITTFLECKKTFFGKFKYYFKYSKNKSKEENKNSNKIRKPLLKQENHLETKIKKQDDNKYRIEEKKNYTIEELIKLYKNCAEKESQLKNLVMDINALKLKSKNTAKKIENATLFINEIENHKKSIFEFWRYTNKDEVSALGEGEQEEVNITKKIVKVFDYEEDLERFGREMDQIQRKKLTKDETDSIYLTTTNVIEILNQLKNNTATPKDIETNLKEMRKKAQYEKTLLESEEFDIFGAVAQDSTKTSTIANKIHRELAKDRFAILDINTNTKSLGYKLSLEKILQNIKKSLQKVEIQEDLPIYKATAGEKLDRTQINVLNINPENEINKAFKSDEEKIILYKFNLKKGTKAVSYTNSIFFDNQNKTLPIGQDISSQILVDISKLKVKIKNKQIFKILRISNEKDDFSDIQIRTVIMYEYETTVKKDDKKDKIKKTKSSTGKVEKSSAKKTKKS